MNYFAVLDSPIDRLLLLSNETALIGLYMDVPAKAGDVDMSAGAQADPSAGVLPLALQQLREYFAGSRRTFDLPLALSGTAFQERVWRALSEIPYGETWSYGQLARHLGNPGASRAVGLANGRNPISIILPCHRVIGADGSLTGYGGGLPRKQWLLAHEASATAAIR
jgi:methylated-DNA-[protein]-cysteine S-methyltransferase